MVSVDDIFIKYDKINGIIIEDYSTRNNIFSLYEEDIMFWAIAYNKLDPDRDYCFLINVRNGEYSFYHHQEIIQIAENTFLDLMETLTEIRQWKNNRFGFEWEPCQNKRIHKLFSRVSLKN